MEGHCINKINTESGHELNWEIKAKCEQTIVLLVLLFRRGSKVQEEKFSKLHKNEILQWNEVITLISSGLFVQIKDHHRVRTYLTTL